MTDANVAEMLREDARILERIPPKFGVTFPGVIKTIHEAAALIDALQRERDFQTGVCKVAVDALQRDLDAATERARQSELKYQSEYSIIDRIWRLFGSPSYEELQGRTIYDLVEAEQKRADESMQDLAEVEAMVNRWETARNALSSLSPRAAQLLAVVAANAKWQSALRASPMDTKGELEGFIELKRTLDALHMEAALSSR